MAELPSATEARLDPTPSALYCNLAVSPDGMIVYAHREEVVVVRALGPARLSQVEAFKAAITSVRFDVLRGRTFVCFTNRFGAFVFDVARDAAILHVPNDGPGEARGCAVVDTGARTAVVVGHTTGEVAICDLNNDLQITGITKVAAHSASITAVAAAPAGPNAIVLATADCEGELRTWNDQLQISGASSFNGDCITGAAMIGSTVAIACGSGQVRLCDVATAQVRIAIGAHSRWINGIDFDPTTQRLATVSEDNLLCVWQMPTAHNGGVALVAHKMHANALLTGCGFSSGFVTCNAYDTETSWTYKLPDV